MKMILEFNLPEENHEAECAMLAGEMYSLLHQLSEKMRMLVKHGEPDREDVEEMRHMILEVMHKLNV